MEGRSRSCLADAKRRLKPSTDPIPLESGKGSDNCALKQKTQTTPDYQGLGSESIAVTCSEAVIVHKGRIGTRTSYKPSRTPHLLLLKPSKIKLLPAF